MSVNSVGLSNPNYTKTVDVVETKKEKNDNSTAKSIFAAVGTAALVGGIYALGRGSVPAAAAGKAKGFMNTMKAGFKQIPGLAKNIFKILTGKNTVLDGPSKWQQIKNLFTGFSFKPLIK